MGARDRGGLVPDSSSYRRLWEHARVAHEETASLPGNSERFDRWAIGLLGLGILVRTLRFLTRGSLWRDEASLALHVLGETPHGDQFPPPGFLAAERLVASLGAFEAPLRTIPLLAGILSLFLFYLVCARVARRQETRFALALFALAEPLVYYSTELKQYSSDVACTLLILWLALALRETWTRGRLTSLAAAGAAAVWFSHPAAIVCAVTGAWLFLREWRRGRFRRAAALAGTCALWLASFVTSFLSTVRSQVDDSYLQEFWAAHFAPLPPRTGEEWLWYVRVGREFLSDPGGLSLTGLAGVALATGLVVLWRRDRDLVGLMSGLPFCTLVLSALRLYAFPTATFDVLPFKGRLLLFLLPVVYLVAGVGMAAFWRFRGRESYRIGLLLVVILLSDPALRAAGNLVDPPVLHDARPVIESLRAHALPDDVVFTQSFSEEVWGYYAALLGMDLETRAALLRHPRHLSGLQDRLESLSPAQRFWLFTVHHPYWASEAERARIESILAARAEPLRRIEGHGTLATLYRIRSPRAEEDLR